MNEDMSEFLGVFLEEAREQLDLLEQDLLVLEREASPDLLQRIFRAAHTLKGSSRAMGFTAMGELTHAMEDILDNLRHGEISITIALTDALLQGLDALKQMQDEISQTGNSTLDTTEQTQALRNVLDLDTQELLPQEAPSALQATVWNLTKEVMEMAQEASALGYGLWHITVHLSSDCMMKSVRALMVLQNIEKAGSLLAISPDEESIESEAFGSSFELLIATQQSIEAVESLILQVSEIAKLDLNPWVPNESSPPSVEAPQSLMPPKVDSGSTLPATSPMPATNEAAKTNSTAPTKQVQTVRVDVERLDTLLNLVGELVIDRTRLVQLGIGLESLLTHQPLLEQLQETSAHIGRITDELQEEIMKARMLPIENVFNRFPRMVRDITQKLGKEVELIIEGRETELDRSIIESISDPLIHMLRNSVDHGIEAPLDRIQAGKARMGTVWVRARHQESHVVIEIEDDGKGIDPERIKNKALQMGILSPETAARMTDSEAIQLIFAAGLSTAKQVSDVSGRGVGMDIVRSNIERLGGTIAISSRLSHGSRFTVKLPLTLAIIRALLVQMHESVFALPLGAVLETLRIEAKSIHLVNHREVILQRGRTLPIIRMSEVFPTRIGQTPAERNSEPLSFHREKTEAAESHFLVVVGIGERQVGLLVERLIGEQEVVIKSLGRFIGDIKGISGATILGDGRVGLIVDINGLIQFATETHIASYS